MAIPKYHKFFPPIIRYLGDNKTHSFQEIIEYCANEMKLSESERNMTGSNGQNKLYYRVVGARTHLMKAGLIESPKHAHLCLTDNGKKAFQNGADNVTLEYTKRLIENDSKSIPTTSDETTNEQFDPQEQIEIALKELNDDLADDIMTQIMKISPYEFEGLVVKLLVAMGYGKPEENNNAVTPKSGDEGIDGVVSADKFGFDSIYIQAKQWKEGSVVGRPEIQKFLGALAGQGASKGIWLSLPKRLWNSPQNNSTQK